MMLARIAYRIQQFWFAATAAPAQETLEQARLLLGPDLYRLFASMTPGEQAHALKVYLRLKSDGEKQPELLSAALLHDVGKTRQPLWLWERVVIVLARATVPQQAKTWGSGPLTRWRRPFVVAERHPDWGAEMAAQAGASALVVELIRRHQETPDPRPVNQADRLLQQLQVADDLS